MSDGSIDMERATSASDSRAPRFYSVAQVAEILGMSTVTLYRAINAGEFPAVRIRSRVIVPAKVVEDLAQRAFDGNPPAPWLPVQRDASGGVL